MKQKSILYSCLALMLLSSCHLFHQEEQVTAKPDLTIGYFPSSDMLPYYLALQQGYFDSLQVRPVFRRLESKLQCDTLYRTGTLDGCIFDLTDALRMSAQGNPIHPVMANEGCFYLIGTPDSTVTDYTQIKDKTIAVTSYAASDFLADRLIAQIGLTGDDVNKPQIGDEYTRLEMLLNGQIDAGVFREPYATQAIRKKAIKLYAFRDMNMPTTVTAFSPTTLDKKTDAIRKLIQGYNRAVKYMNSHPVRSWYREVADSIGFPHWNAPIRIAPFQEARPIPKAVADSTAKWMKRHELIPDSYIGDIIDRSVLDSVPTDTTSTHYQP